MRFSSYDFRLVVLIGDFCAGKSGECSASRTGGVDDGVGSLRLH